MAEPARNEPTSPLPARGQTPLVALVLMVATAMGVLNLSSRPGGTPANESGPRPPDAAALLAPTSKATPEDALEALEPLLRFLNPSTNPRSLDEVAGRLDGYRVTTVIASVSDPIDSRLGYDFDMAIEAIQRAAESEGYTLDRFRFPWLESAPTPTAPAPPAAAPGAASGTAPKPPTPTVAPTAESQPEARASARARSSSGSIGPPPRRGNPRNRRTCCCC